MPIGARKKRGGRPAIPAEHGLRRADVPSQRHWSVKSEETRVAHAVVLDGVAAPHDFPDDVGMRGSLLADTEETCFDAVAVQDVQHHRRDFRVRAVVERDGNFSAARRRIGQANHVLAEQAAPGPHSDQSQSQVIGNEHGHDPRPPGRLEKQRNKCGQMNQYAELDCDARAPWAGRARGVVQLSCVARRLSHPGRQC